MTHVTDNSDHRAPRTLWSAELNLLANRLFTGPDARRKQLINKDDRLRSFVIARRQSAATRNRNAQSLDIAWGHSIPERTGSVFGISQRFVLDLHAEHVEIAAERKLTHYPGGLHPRQ